MLFALKEARTDAHQAVIGTDAVGEISVMVKVWLEWSFRCPSMSILMDTQFSTLIESGFHFLDEGLKATFRFLESAVEVRQEKVGEILWVG
ncbi:unnamed protein product [marine sediment metagenome]|uniref:Uncharacterized protein n=1 Tax=marine sediment metagenome TaxID=412755 RepID=X1TQ59_9ZZZZ